jgi:acetyl-CoA carboxylase/biotin carboxylase 1
MLTLKQVVVDPTINAEYMEMYADEDGRGGVLEPEGIVNIKFRRDKLLETMARLDPTYAELKRQLADNTLSNDEQSDLKVKMTERETLLIPVYTQISLQFADLHDRAGRMEAKGTIRQPLQWKNARRFFYWRLRRRLNEEAILKKMNAISVRGPPTTRERNLEILQAWTGISAFEKDDKAVAMWYEENRKEVHAKVEGLRNEGVAFEVASLLRGNKEGGLKGIRQVLGMLPVEERESVLKYLGGA